MATETTPGQNVTAQVADLTKPKGIFENIGGVAGVAYGLYFANTKKVAWWGYIFWAVIFGLAFHEIGEQGDRLMKKIKG